MCIMLVVVRIMMIVVCIVHYDGRRAHHYGRGVRYDANRDVNHYGMMVVACIMMIVVRIMVFQIGYCCS